jgi:hypothetical protein
LFEVPSHGSIFLKVHVLGPATSRSKLLWICCHRKEYVKG